MQTLLQDLRLGLRMLRRNPGFTAVSVLTLALGIGLVSTQFSMIDGALLRPLPYPDSDRLFHFARLPRQMNEELMPMREFLALREQQTAFDDLAAYRVEFQNLSHPSGTPRRLRGLAVTASFFRLLRMAPQIGRDFHAGEDGPGQPLLAVIGHGVWQEEFGGDPAVIGRAVRINGEPGTVIGVMPAGFRFPQNEECWVNLRPRTEPATGVNSQRVHGMGLLKAGVTPRQAAANLEVIARRVWQNAPQDDQESFRIAVRPFPLVYAGSGTVALLGTMLAMTVLVLVLACGNVANLLFARAAGRWRELAVRSSLGAGRGRLFRQLLTESLALAALGAVLGTLFAAWGVQALDTQVTEHIDVESWTHFRLDARVLAVTTVLAVAAGLTAGVLPAVRASRVNLNDALKDNTRGATGLQLGRISRWLVTGQLAFACGLMVVAALLALSALRSSRANLGFNPESLLIGRIELQAPAYRDPDARVRFYNQLVEQVRATPGVVAAAVSSRDLVSPGVYTQYEIEGAAPASEGDKPGGRLEVVSRDYFQILDCGALQGRLFGAEDISTGPPVAVINQSLAARHWPGGDPLGRRIRRAEPDAKWATIVGIVPDLCLQGLVNNDPPAGWYLLQDQQAWGWLNLLVRAQGDPRSIIPPVRAAVAWLDPEQPIHTITTLSERTAHRVGGLQMVGTMTIVFALTALVLTGVGVYGVMAFAVQRRTREFGIRLALGATGREILGLLFQQNALGTSVGVAAGLGLGFALTRPLAPYLLRVSANDPIIYAGVAIVLVAITVVAIWIPSRRAARVDPNVALRCE